MTRFNQAPQLCFTQASQIMQLAQQDSLSQWAISLAMQDSLWSFFLTWKSQEPASVTDGRGTHQGDSKPCSRTSQNIYASIYEFFGDNYSRLAGVDWNVVYLLIRRVRGAVAQNCQK